jgi:Dolichyl-phosphate-mannose-protein mannosyltransferase
LKIAVEGYTYNGNDLIEQPVVFYPLYPFIAKVFSIFLDIDETIALLVVSNASIAIAIPLIFKLIKHDYGHETALYSIALLSFFPTSLFFSAGYTESLTLLLTIEFFLLLKGGRLLSSAICAGLATATRLTGIVLLLPLLWGIWHKFSKQYKRLKISMMAYLAVAVLLATSGLWSYMIYLGINFNMPWAFMTAQHAWLKGNDVGSNLFKVLTLQPFYHLGDLLRNGLETYTLDSWFFLLFLILICLFGKRLSVSYKIYALAVLLLPYLTLSGGLGFRSFTRYIILAFPVFIIMGDMLKQTQWIA